MKSTKERKMSKSKNLKIIATVCKIIVQSLANVLFEFGNENALTDTIALPIRWVIKYLHASALALTLPLPHTCRNKSRSLVTNSGTSLPSIIFRWIYWNCRLSREKRREKILQCIDSCSISCSCCCHSWYRSLLWHLLNYFFSFIQLFPYLISSILIWFVEKVKWKNEINIIKALIWYKVTKIKWANTYLMHHIIDWLREIIVFKPTLFLFIIQH